MSVDELREFGLKRMSAAEIDGFLASQRTGVLGLPAESVPYLLPLSYGYEDGTVYFTYVVGSESRKQELTERGGQAAFLVYNADSPFNWESVAVSGPLSAVPESEWDDLTEILSDVWRPAILEEAQISGETAVYELSIEDQSGVKHTGLPPGFDPENAQGEQ